MSPPRSNMRAPGMTLMRLPMLVWMEITVAVVFLLSVSPLVAEQSCCFSIAGSAPDFFRPDKGGDPHYGTVFSGATAKFAFDLFECEKQEEPEGTDV
jgi:hypothetical protein